jgi:addiction module HigA family antidote
MGISQYRLALDPRIPHSRVTAIIRGHRALTPDTALLLSRYFGTSAEFWGGLQQEFDMRQARARSAATINAEVVPYAG